MDSNLTQYTIMQSLSTGNIFIDMILSILISSLISQFIPQIQHFFKNVIKINDNIYYNYSRVIEANYKHHFCYGYISDTNDDLSHSIIKALHIYLRNNYEENYNHGQIKLIDVGMQNLITDETKNPSALNNKNGIQLISEPLNNKIIDIPNSNIKYFKYEEETFNHNGEKHSMKKGIKLISNTLGMSNAKQEIDQFIEKALEWYNNLMENKDGTCYMYKLVSISIPSIYRKYKLNNNKTFSSLFLPDKNKIIDLLDNFSQKKGKFSIKGTSQKLGFLLYGPPGTGKTSLIKSISNYTKRHIIEIPLNRVKSNSELEDIVFHRKYKLENDNIDELEYSEIIFVLEDIDCISNIIQKRLSNPFYKNQKTDKYKDKDKENVKEINDPLSLSGILNVIDGIIDCPNRILIMTTNYPENIDPALIRPGRVNLQVFLDYIKYEQACELLKNYNIKINGEQKETLFNHLNNVKITPAMLEQYCITYDDIKDILNSIENCE